MKPAKPARRAGPLRVPGGMRRRLFVTFGVVISLSAAAAICFAWISQSTLGGGSPWERVNRMSNRQIARQWEDPTARARHVQDIADSFPVRVRLMDVDGQVLHEAGGEASGVTHSFVIRRGGTSLGRIEIQARNLRGPMTLAAALLVFASVLWFASGHIARRIVRPLEHLADVARDIGDGKLTRRAVLTRSAGGEVGHLAGSINDMAGRIEQQLADQRAMLAAVSHELRTPLGHLRILLELAEDEDNPRRRLMEMSEELIEMDTLVGELLASSRLDFTELQLRDEAPGDLALRALLRCGADPDCLQIGDAVPATVALDPTLIARALANLIDNAEKHGGGVVGLHVKALGDELCFEVHDEGAGFDPTAREHLFTPFMDGGSERSSLGLGLSLVRRIAEAHGGRAYAHNRADKGACFGFALPVVPSV